MEARIILQNDEAEEAGELMAAWLAREAELPRHLRQELQAVQQTRQFSVVAIGPIYDVQISPRVRALVANLRSLA